MSIPLATADIEELARRIAELTNGGNVTQRCVSLTDGALSPDLRVNYEFGLVLGVDEFRQEQLYHLEKDYQHNRSLHGYGTVYGLRVTTSRPGADGDDVLVTVEPGMAIDQWGRAVVVRDPQCARLGPWLEKHAPPNQGPSGELSVYVVVHYDECPDVLQPIPGQPCSGSNANQAASRIRDSFHIELRWEPPEMRAWRAVQRFARLLAAVRIEPNLPPDLAHSDEQVIMQQVNLLDQVGESLFDPGGAGVGGLDLHPARDFLVLPADGARDALDRIFILWATRVRPRLRPELSDPAGGGSPNAPGVVLARIDFVGSAPFIDESSLSDAADNSVRPFLLHTQLMQELLLLGDHEDVQQEFATLEAFGTRVVHAWVHYSGALDVSESSLRLTLDGQPATITSVRRLDEGPVFEIVYEPPVFVGGVVGPVRRRVDGGVFSDVIGREDLPHVVDGIELPSPGHFVRAQSGTRVELTFLLDRMGIGARGRFSPLLNQVGGGYVGYDRQTNTIRTYTMIAPEDQAFAEVQVRGGGVLHVAVRYPRLLAVPGRDALRVWSNDEELTVIAVERLVPDANRFKVVVGVEPGDVEHPGLRLGRFVAGAQVDLAFLLPALLLADETPLLPDMDRRGLAYVGRWHEQIVVRVLADRVAALRTLVTITTLFSENLVPQLELWFHTNTDGLVHFPLGPEVKPAMRVWREERDVALHFQADPVEPVEIDGRQFAARWRLSITDDVDQLQPNERLSFTFYTDRIRVAPLGGTLAQQIRQYRLAFLGYNGNDRVRMFYRVALPASQQTGGGLSEEQVRAIIRDSLVKQPVLPFVTVTPFAGVPYSQPPRLQLWFHLDVRPTDDEVWINNPQFRLLVEFDPPWLPDPSQTSPVALETQLLARPQHNVFVYGIEQSVWYRLSQYGYVPRFCRLVFNTDANRLTDAREEDRGSLVEFIQATGVKFDGHNGGDTIVAYVRIPDLSGTVLDNPNG